MCRSSHPRETSTSIRPPTRRPAARRALHPHLGRAGKAWDDAGVVQFAAAWRSPDGDGTLRERSRFTMIDGRWYYLDGVLG
ncbi:MAG TPA: hypothetical protein GX013_02525 [Propionibacterium sp.]|nr:hypothetical protein [Propionibacterium sp.]